ncbi:phosphate starvation-inducible protein PhoH, predicted ATPase [Leptospirillum ferriphilum ML-04]|uniref:PhoH-like protein n=1 Tax=Leptospirillum ferriphilum (strain ML-04) TaxID=1048260 RepID=J9ZAX3_LEPFM|nr:phosphate starvation-inducible protein PhoH, predicted ATPase [Leptospirillum ferriphilum ML-04]
MTATGEESRVVQGEKVIGELASLMASGYSIREEEIRQAINLTKTTPHITLRDLVSEFLPINSRKRVIFPKSANQLHYIQAIKAHDIVFGIGPAGTGKTYLAMAMAVFYLLKHSFRRIILVRPAVEAGEKLGFLPGDIAEKINPYLRPLYDALFDMIDVDKVNRMIDKREIEIAPLAFMRGRTLNDSFVILDEAQNATIEQMKMFLTRIGFNSKAVITGDVTQIDLPQGRTSGLIEVQNILKNISGIEFLYFNEVDVVRHRLVQEIIKAYERYENPENGQRSPADKSA